MARLLAASLLASTSLAVALPAAADSNDLALNRLSYYTPENGAPVYAGGCATAATSYASCHADNQLFANLANQLGAVLAPSLLTPASTVGYNGVYLGYENSFTNVASGGTSSNGAPRDYWIRGTLGSPGEGGVMGTGTAERRARTPDVLFVSRLHVRKGFPFGFEVGTQVSWLHGSGLFALGGEIRWALFEGFRHPGSAARYLPDLAVRASVNTLVGNPQMFLTVLGFDAVISKPITIASAFRLTPYLGAQGLLIFADSTVIDLSPTRSGYSECARRETQFSSDPTMPSTQQCAGGTPLPVDAAGNAVQNDSMNDQVFLSTRLLRARGFAGLQLRAGIFTASAEVGVDLTSASFSQGTAYRTAGRPDANGDQGAVVIDAFRQWTTTLGAGVTF